MALTNGNFETGDLTGWDDSESSGGTVEVVAAAVRNGTYGLRLKGDIINPAQDYPLVTQMMPRDFSTITLWYKCNDISGTATPNCYLTVNIVTDTDFWAEVYEVHNPAEGGWIEVTVSKATITSENGMATEDWGTGDIQLRIEQTTSSTTAGDVSFDLFIDDVHYETIANGGFELGDLTSWANGNTGSGTYSGTQTVTTGAKRSGSYGCQLYGAAQSEGYVHSYIEMELATSGWDYFDFWARFDGLDLSFTGFTQFEVIVYYLVDSSPAFTNVFMDSAKNMTDWRQFRILFDQCDQARIAAGGVWDTTIPVRFSLYVYNEEGTSKDNTLFLDDINVWTISDLENGDFEDGDLAGLLNESYADVDDSTVDNGAATAAASGTEKHAGSYAAKLNCTAYDTASAWDVESGISVPITVADFSTLNFWYKITDATGGSPTFVVQVLAFESVDHYAQWIDVWEIGSFAVGSWTEVTITKSEMTSALTALGFEFADTTQIRLISKMVYIPS